MVLGAVNQLTGTPHESESWTTLEGVGLMSNDPSYFVPVTVEAMTPDGRGGFYVHHDRLREGRLYPLEIGGQSLAIVKDPDGSISIYGLPA